MMASASSSKVRAIALLSGGLDSTLAIQLMLEQGIDVLAVNFVGPFCRKPGPKWGGQAAPNTESIKVRW